MEYFKYLPKITYREKSAINILARGKVREAILKNIYSFYPYTVAEGERADIIADKYYGSSSLTWLIYYANNIFDPILDWPLDYEDFNRYLIEKYKTQSGETKDTNILAYTKSAVNHYTKDGLIVDSETEGKTTVYIYDHELNLNNAKRGIKLIDNLYLGQILKEMRVLFL